MMSLIAHISTYFSCLSLHMFPFLFFFMKFCFQLLHFFLVIKTLKAVIVKESLIVYLKNFNIATEEYV